jgi:hypothetical protein
LRIWVTLPTKLVNLEQRVGKESMSLGP